MSLQYIFNIIVTIENITHCPNYFGRVTGVQSFSEFTFGSVMNNNTLQFT